MSWDSIERRIIRLICSRKRFRSEQFQTETHVTTPEPLIRHTFKWVSRDFWCDPSKRVLDPACGSGGFLDEAIRRMFRGMMGIIKDPMKRLRVCFERIRGFDIDEAQCRRAWTLLMPLARLAGLRLEDVQRIVVQRDFLVYNEKVKFDLIVGNPPYNPPKKQRSGGSGSGNKIWPKFVEKAFELVADDGHIIMVTPSKWRDGTFTSRAQHRTAQELMWANTILHYRDVKDAFPSVGHSISIDAWHVQKGMHETSLPQKELERWKVFPTRVEAAAIVGKFLVAGEANDVYPYRDRNRTRLLNPSQKGPEHVFRYANTSAQTRKGEFLWAAVKSDDFSMKKVIVSNSGAFEPWFDDGTCGVGSHAAAYIVETDDEGARLVQFLNGKLVKFIAKQFMQEGAIGFPYELFRNIPKSVIQGLGVFGFTHEELQLIDG